jgi:hypothetical protein
MGAAAGGQNPERIRTSLPSSWASWPIPCPAGMRPRRPTRANGSAAPENRPLGSSSDKGHAPTPHRRIRNQVALSSSAASTFSYHHARDLAALSVTTTNAIVARASAPAQTSALVARVGRSVASRSARRRCSTIRGCASLSAYRGAAVLFKFLDVLVAAAQPVPRLVGGLCCAAGFNAHGAERNGGTAVEGCAH